MPTGPTCILHTLTKIDLTQPAPKEGPEIRVGAGVTSNAHALVQRFPLLDNFYDPSRQSADGHDWIVQAMAPYSDDIQSPDWRRAYRSNGGDAIAYQKTGHLWDCRSGSLSDRGRTLGGNTQCPVLHRRWVLASIILARWIRLQLLEN